MSQTMAIIGLFLITMIWGGGFVASDVALLSFTPFQIMTIRFLIGTILMGLFHVKDLKSMKKEEVLSGMFMGIALFLAYALQTIGLQYTTPSKNAFLTALNVGIVPILAFLFLRKKMNKTGIVGAILSVVGVGFLSLNADFSLGFGDVLTLLCAIAFAVQILLTSIFVKKCRTSVLNFIQMGTAFFLSFASMCGNGEFYIRGTTKGWIAVLYLGIVSTTICYFVQTACQQYVEETKVAIILSMESVFGTLLSVMILQEEITSRMMIGCFIILSAVIISNINGEEDVIKTTYVEN